MKSSLAYDKMYKNFADSRPIGKTQYGLETVLEEHILLVKHEQPPINPNDVVKAPN